MSTLVHYGLLVATLITVGLDPTIAQPRVLPGDAQHGHELAQRWCSTCHLVSPEQQRATDAVPPFASVARRPQTNAESLRAFLLIPHYASRMPDLHLSQPEIDDLVAYIISLRKPAQ
jgi:mono/diheme cytochrome c family protein